MFNNSEEARNKIFNKLKDLVEQLNLLIKVSHDEYGNDIGIYDTQSTWQEEYIYRPIVYEFGKKLIIRYLKSSSINIIEVEYDLEKSMILKEIVENLEDIIKKYRKFLKKKGIYPLTPNDFNNLNKFMNELINLSKTTNYINLETTKNDSFTYFVENNLEEDLKKYNTIPGVYMEQSGNYIKIYISLTKIYFIIHEQYLHKIYKLYQSIKN